ncbi:hypothetical protein [Aliiroseovarius crassostreae]|uniref:hypothetical protein n=1 Tax=Aliiroseovarius crassostreae TaxID=154981 RepID=UPI00220B284D|nr:hypothetical protein [Aliiroseovarius crassostreae]UWQ04405.1 hypothetical protein K3X22_12095 [Aliiroseovarius crassostreae]
MKPLFLAAAMTCAMAIPSHAQQSQPAKTGLSVPVIMLTGILNKNQDVVGLDEAQKEILQNWMASMPAQRKALEDETVALRAEMKAAIIKGSPVEERQALAGKIGANETTLVMMRSNCTDHWREVLTPEQFAKLIEIATK